MIDTEFDDFLSAYDEIRKEEAKNKKTSPYENENMLIWEAAAINHGCFLDESEGYLDTEDEHATLVKGLNAPKKREPSNPIYAPSVGDDNASFKKNNDAEKTAIVTPNFTSGSIDKLSELKDEISKLKMKLDRLEVMDKSTSKIKKMRDEYKKLRDQAEKLSNELQPAPDESGG